MSQKKNDKKKKSKKKPPESIYYYTFAYMVCPAEEFDNDNESNKSIQITDVILRGNSESKLSSTIERIITKCTELGLHVYLDPQPIYIKRKKKEIIEFFESQKSSILKQEENWREAKKGN